MHTKAKGVEICDESFCVNGQELPMVTKYKYLGCVVDEFLTIDVMMELRAEMGKRVLSVWLLRLRQVYGEVKGGTFLKLMDVLVESVLLYGAEVWGCMQRLEALEQVQLRGLRIFFGVGIHHPKASLWSESDIVQVTWIARVRCTSFWLQILNDPIYNGRILKKVAEEAIECGGKWVHQMRKCLEDFEWRGGAGLV